MADIEVVIKIPEKTVNDIKDNAMFAGSISSDVRWDVTSAIVNGTPLPDNATNGDVIKALFPQNKYIEGERYVIINGKTENISIWNNWWNTPYKENKDGR